MSGRLSSGFPSLLPAPSDMSPSKITSPAPPAPAAASLALAEIFKFDLPGFPRRARPAGALTKSVKLESEEVGVCPLRAVPFCGNGWE